MPLDESWPWRSELGEDPVAIPPGYATLSEAQSAHDELAMLWETLKLPERRAFLKWFQLDGPHRWPFSREDTLDLRDILNSLRK